MPQRLLKHRGSIEQVRRHAAAAHGHLVETPGRRANLVFCERRGRPLF